MPNLNQPLAVLAAPLETRQLVDELLDKKTRYIDIAARVGISKSAIGRYALARRRNQKLASVYTGGKIGVLWPNTPAEETARLIRSSDWLVEVLWVTGEIRNDFALLSDEQKAELRAQEQVEKDAALQIQLETAAASAPERIAAPEPTPPESKPEPEPGRLGRTQSPIP